MEVGQLAVVHSGKCEEETHVLKVAELRGLAMFASFWPSSEWPISIPTPGFPNLTSWCSETCHTLETLRY